MAWIEEEDEGDGVCRTRVESSGRRVYTITAKWLISRLRPGRENMPYVHVVAAIVSSIAATEKTAKLIVTSNFSAIDWVIVAVYLCVSVVIGLLVKRYIKNMTDFVVAGRQLGTWLGLATMIGTEMGLVTIMFQSEMGFRHGFAAFIVPLIFGVAALVVGVTGFGVVRLRKTGVLTIPEYYERRYGRNTRILGAIILAVCGLLNMGLFLSAGAIFIGGITGLTDPIHHKIIMTILLALVLAYTMLGGMLSVVLTDYIQFVMLSAGALVTTILALKAVGWSNIVAKVSEFKGVSGFDPVHPKSELGWLYILFMVTIACGNCLAWQPNVMRACAAKDGKTVKRIYGWSSIGFLIRFLIPNLWGVCALVFILNSPQFKEAFFAKEAQMSGLSAMPLFLGQILPAGVIGIVTAAMLAAFMSTHDSYLLAWSSVIVQDVVAPLCGGRISTKARIGLTRLVILLIGAFLLIWGLWFPLKTTLWNYMALTAVFYMCGAMVVIVGGLYWRRATPAGAVAAMLAGFIPVFGLDPIQELLGTHFNLFWLAVTSVPIAALLFMFFSVVPDSPKRQQGEALRP